MTEEEAKTKWCPFARFVIDAQTVFPTGNRFDGQGGTSRTAVEASEQCHCIGSACMAWRWLPSGGNRDKIEAIRAHREKHGSDLRTAKEAVEASWSDPKTQGFCGLAGAPR